MLPNEPVSVAIVGLENGLATAKVEIRSTTGDHFETVIFPYQPSTRTDQLHNLAIKAVLDRFEEASQSLLGAMVTNETK